MKIAIISDLHISTRWIGSLSIENQSKKLADRLVDYCRSADIHHLFIAGDIIDKAIDRPEIPHAVKYVFKKFSEYFTDIYYILGQHDLAVNPVGEVKETDTLLTLFDYPNLHYAHGTILTLGNTKIGMANYSRNSQYKFPEFVDLYITHFTVSDRFGQKIDNSQFGTMIAGDIHHKVNIKNMHSIGSFQQQSISKDSEWNNVCIWDCDTKELQHINIGGGLVMRNSEIHSGLVDGVFYELKRTPNIISSAPIVDKFKDDNYLRIIEQVRQFMIEKGLESMNSEVANQIDDLHNFSTDFNIEYFKVYNFRKIHQFEISFNKGDKILLTGKNGSGKSTFLISLFAALTGNLTWSSVQGGFDEEVYTELILTYAGNRYTLRRGSGYQWLLCNGVDVPYKNRNDFNSVVSQKLPFLQDLGILFQRPEVGTLFEGISSDAKLSLVSKIYHLEYLDQLYSTGERIKQGYVKKLNELGYNIKQLNIRKDKLKLEIEPLLEYKNLDIQKLKSEYDELVELQSKSERYRTISDKVTKLNADISANTNLISKSNETLNGLDKVKYDISVEKHKKLTESKSNLDLFTKKLNELKDRKAKLSSDISKLRENKCPRCNQVWVDESSQLELKRLEDEMRKLDSDINSLELNISALEVTKSQFDQIPILKSEIDSYNSTINSCNTTIDNCNKELVRLRKELEILDVPEKFEFTTDDLSKLLTIKDKLSKVAQLLEKAKDLDEVTESIGNQETEKSDLQSKVDELGTYNWYVCKSGPIYRGILEQLCEQWSNDYVKFSLFEGKYRGNDYLDIKISYLKGTNWQDYSASSSGEKSYMDILFIEAVTANAGFLILDEFLRHMDDDVHVRSIDEINKINVNLFILSSFNPNLYFANRRIYAQYLPELDECRLEVE